MKILTIYDHSGPKYHRCLLPCFLMDGVELIVKGELKDEDCEGVDIVFFNRVLVDHSVQSVLGLRKKHGFKLVVDFDDHWQLGTDHYLHQMYEYTGASHIMRAYIKECDAVTVTHERLADEVLPLNKNVWVLPNAIPKWGQFLCEKQPDDLTRLFWAGGITHVNDIQLLFEPVKSFRELPVKMVMGGYVKRSEYYQMRNAFTRYGKMPHELIEAMPVDKYYYAYSRCDIALVPLTETKFNSMKSPLKILEAANIGANVVVSDVHPYKDFPGVEYVNSPEDWRRHVKTLLDNPGYAAEQRQILQDYCREHYNFETINQKRKTLFESLCSYTTGKDLKNTEALTTAG